MERTIPPRVARRLAAKPPLELDPKASIAIKRDVHHFIIQAAPQQLTAAFRAVMEDAEARFGLIRVKRPADRMGRPFEPGERFQGCFSLEWALQAALGRVSRRAGRLLGRVLGVRPLAWLLARMEDLFLSDYGEILEMQLDPDLSRGERFQLRYRYLAGTPIAGSSTFRVEPWGEGRCRLTQIFEYQEIGGMALGSFQRFGLKMHDEVVLMQARRAAEAIGAPLLESTIPAEYAAAPA